MRLSVVGAAHVCARCASQGPTCCEPEEGVALAPLTPGDIERIRAATGLAARAFVRTRTISEDERSALESQDPVLKGLVHGGRLRSLRKEGRACVFHDRAHGCSLAWDVRPLLCRRFPFLRVRGRIHVQPGGECLACDEAPDLEGLLSLLGMDEAGLRALDRALRRDLDQ